METAHPRYLLRNGELIAYEKATVHVLSTAMKYGAIVFEGFRAYWNESQGELYCFRLHDHFQRMVGSLRISRIPGATDVDAYVDDLLGLIRANELRQDLHIRVQAFVEADDGSLSSVEPVTVTMAAMPMGRYFRHEGLHVQVSSWRRISDSTMPPRVKTVPNYHNSRLALLQARVDGYDDAILLTSDGHVAEGPGYALFMIRDGLVVTPPSTDGILESITRHSIITLARRAGLTVVERSIDRTELYLAEELFFCGTAAEVTPILSVDRHAVGEGSPGQRTGQLIEAYRAVTIGEVADELGWRTPVYAGAAVPAPHS
jgi:branched-chain amino acid aminotransferase